MSFAVLSRKSETALSKTKAAPWAWRVGRTDGAFEDRGPAVHEKPGEGEVAKPHWSLSSMTIEPPRNSSAERIQTKLAVNEPGDKYEEEADQMADRVVRMSEARAASGIAVSSAVPGVQRKCSCGGGCDKCQTNHGDEREDERQHLQMKRGESGGFRQTTAPPIVHEALRSPGRPLDPATRAFMEPRFRHDFSSVRVHTGMPAERSAQTMGAAAYTVGNDIVFASGRLVPESQEGRRLIAHELTHVVQQSRGMVATLQRQPDRYQMSDPSRSPMKPMGFHGMGLSGEGPADRLFFYQDRPRRGGQAGDLHDVAVTQGFMAADDPGPVVTSANILDWVLEKTWSDAAGQGRPTRIFNLLLWHEDATLNKVWDGNFNQKLKDIQSSWEFVGSDAARSRWADFVNSQRTNVIDLLNARANYRLVEEIKATLLSAPIPAGAALVTDPAEIERIHDHREEGTFKIYCGFGSLCDQHVDFTWGGKRIQSISRQGEVAFEVVGREGIYFDISSYDFAEDQPFLTKASEQIVANATALKWVGGFVKGMLDALASPLMIAKDTAAKLIDMETQFESFVVKKVTGKDLPYTCLSSTCKNYEACLESDESPDRCKSDARTAAIEEATVIIPLYRQGRDCVKGDAEACGSIAALSLGFVHEGLDRLSVSEFKGAAALEAPKLEDAAIREAIGRPAAGDPNFAKAMEKPKAVAEPRPAAKPSSPKSKAELKLERDLEKIHRPQIREFAAEHGIPPRQLDAEIQTLSRDSDNPAKVKAPTGEYAKDYDAEMKTAVNGDNHTYRRQELGTKNWCRFSGEPACGVPGAPSDATINETLRKSTRKAAADQAGTDPAVKPTEPLSTDSPSIELGREELRSKKAKAKAADDAKRQAAVERRARQIADDRSTKLRIEQDIAEVDQRPLKGRTEAENRRTRLAREAKKDALRKELGRYDARIGEAQKAIGGLSADPLVRLRAYSYSLESERVVINRAGGIDEYSKLAGGPGKRARIPSIDHLNSIDEIATFDGFLDLSESDQRRIVSKPYNLNLMEKGLNSSKGNRTQLTGWKEGRIAYEDEGIAKMAELKSAARQQLKADIAALLKRSEGGVRR